MKKALILIALLVAVGTSGLLAADGVVVATNIVTLINTNQATWSYAWAGDDVIEALELAAEFVRPPDEVVTNSPAYLPPEIRLRQMADEIERKRKAVEKIRAALERMKLERRAVIPQ